MNEIKIIKYSDIFLSCYSDNAWTGAPIIKEHVMIYVLAGGLKLSGHGKITKIHSGECAFIRKGSRVRISKLPQEEAQFQSISLSFSRKFLREVCQALCKKQVPKDVVRQSISVYKLPANRPDIVSLFESIAPCFNSGISLPRELIKSKMIASVHLLLSVNKSFYSSLFDFIEPWKIDILDYMNENYMYDLSMEEIASFTGRSLAAFKRDFKKISSLSPQKWLVRKRLEEARRQIDHEGKKASDACFEVGFKSLSHFSTAYKRQYGVSPTGG